MKLLAIFLLVAFLILVIPVPAAGFQLVPCGVSVDSQHPEGSPETKPCTFQHLVILIVRVLNYLITVAAIVAMYMILLASWNLITSVGNSEKIEKAKSGISQALVGLAIIALSFVFVNLLVNGIFSRPSADTRRWWNVDCIYNIKAVNCPGLWNPPQ